MTLVEILIAVAILGLALFVFLTVALAARGTTDKGHAFTVAAQQVQEKIAGFQAGGYAAAIDGTTVSHVGAVPQGVMTVKIGPLDGSADNANLKQIDVTLAWAQSSDALPGTGGSVHQTTLLANRILPTATTGAGYARREYWLGIDGADVSAIPTSTPPNGTDTLTSLEGPTNWAESFGDRTRGYLTIPASGAYVFWIASDDASQFWLSTDADPANKQQIAFAPGYTGQRAWTTYASQKSAPITLTRGKKYYFEVLHKEATGPDYVAVGWAKPGQSAAAPTEIVPGSALSPYP